jgi:hypothetical protein
MVSLSLKKYNLYEGLFFYKMEIQYFGYVKSIIIQLGELNDESLYLGMQNII